MNILVACEFSGIVRDAFIKRGHTAVSCDLLPTESFGPHIQGDILGVLGREITNAIMRGGCQYDLMIAHPPCTYICNSGVSWLYNKDGSRNEERWKKMEDAANFFKQLLNISHIPHIAIENPIPHKYALEIIGRKYDQIVHPCWFGHMEQKATCLWLNNLPKLSKTNNVCKEMRSLPDNKRQRLHYIGPSEKRWKERSITYSGFADAMAEQWGNQINYNNLFSSY